MFLLSLLGYVLILYFVYEKIFKIYYRFFYYWRQGIPSVGFPLPVLNNLLQLSKLVQITDQLKITPFEEMWYRNFPGGRLPKVI